MTNPEQSYGFPENMVIGVFARRGFVCGMNLEFSGGGSVRTPQPCQFAQGTEWDSRVGFYLRRMLICQQSILREAQNG